jgi:hypothetical protein
MNQPTNLRTQQYMVILSVLFILWAIYIVLTSIGVYDKTGLIKVKTTSPSSAISVSSLNYSAALLGTGNSNNRLLPGKYLILAQASGKTTSEVVSLSNKKVVNVSLNLSKPNVLPSIYSINFSNTSYLLGQGISNGQLGLIEKSLFSFAPNAKNITFINNSVSYAPYDPNTSTSFIMYFSLKIDSTSYKAAMYYSSLNSIDLTLSNSASIKVFDSGVVSF